MVWGIWPAHQQTGGLTFSPCPVDTGEKAELSKHPPKSPLEGGLLGIAENNVLTCY